VYGIRTDISERLRHDPWRMLVAIYLLNKTTGRAANPIREEIFRRWPSAHDLAAGKCA
jgi:methyl-CpG-binding domain protein 4